MFYLVAAILLNVLISALFKLFPRFHIDTLQAIVVNYLVCVVTGSLFIGCFPFHAGALAQPWAPWAALTGFAFISIFSLLAFCTRIDGITTTIIANKLSLVIPVLVAVALFGERLGLLKITGILLAFPAAYLTTRTGEGGSRNQSLLWPAALFVGSGLLDTLMNYVQHTLLTTPQVQATFAVFSFAAAGAAGIPIIVVLLLFRKMKLHWQSMVAGIIVGIPNYFSIYYLIRTLNCNLLQSSATIPVLNIGILVASAITAFLFFREKMNVWRVVGLALSVGAIALIAFGDKS